MFCTYKCGTQCNMLCHFREICCAYSARLCAVAPSPKSSNFLHILNAEFHTQ